MVRILSGDGAADRLDAGAAWTEYERDRDAASLARKWALFFRARFGPSPLPALAPTRTASPWLPYRAGRPTGWNERRDQAGRRRVASPTDVDQSPERPAKDCRNGSSGAGFWTPASRGAPLAPAARVQKAPRHEDAGRLGGRAAKRYGDLIFAPIMTVGAKLAPGDLDGVRKGSWKRATGISGVR